MYSYRKHIAYTCQDILAEYDDKAVKTILTYCEEFIDQFRKNNPGHNIPRVRTILQFAINKYSSGNEKMV